jgi:hypothetical protein
MVVSADITGRSAGTYSSVITVNAPGASNSPQTVSVNLSVYTPGSPPAIGISPQSLSFTTTQGSNPQDQVIGIWNSGGGNTMSWNASSNQTWLTLSQSSGTSTAGSSTNVTVSINASSLGVGTHNATITVTAAGASNSPQTVPVTLTVNPVAPPPAITRDPTSLSFTATTGGANPANQTFDVWNSGGSTLNWTASSNQTWLTLNPSSGSSTGSKTTVTASVNISGLSAGTYSGAITISDPGASNSPQTISVALTVNAPGVPTIGLNPTSLSYTYVIGGTAPADKTFQVSNTGAGTLNWTAASNQTWAGVSPTSGSLASGSATTVAVSVNISGMAAGTHYATITVSAAGASNSPQQVSVTLTIQQAQSLLIGVGTFDANSIGYGDLPNGQYAGLLPGGLTDAQVQAKISDFMNWIQGLGFNEVDVHAAMPEGQNSTDEYYYYFDSPYLAAMNQTSNGKPIIQNATNSKLLGWIRDAAIARQMSVSVCIEMFGSLGASMYSNNWVLPDFTTTDVSNVVGDLKALGFTKINGEGFYLDLIQPNPPDYIGPIVQACGSQVEFAHLFDEPSGRPHAYGSEDFDIYPRNDTEYNNYYECSDIGWLNVMFGHARAMGKPSYVLTWGAEARLPASWQKNRIVFRAVADNPNGYSWGGMEQQELDYLRGTPPGFNLTALKTDIQTFQGTETKPVCNLILDVPDDADMRSWFPQPEGGMFSAIGNAIYAAGYDLQTTYIGPGVTGSNYLPAADLYYYVGYGTDEYGDEDFIDQALFNFLTSSPTPVVFHAGAAPAHDSGNTVPSGQVAWDQVLGLFGLGTYSVSTSVPSTVSYKSQVIKWAGYEVDMPPLMAEIPDNALPTGQTLLTGSSRLIIGKNSTGKYVLVNSNVCNLEATYTLADVLATLNAGLSSPVPMDAPCFAYISRGKRTAVYAGDDGNADINPPLPASTNVRVVHFNADGTWKSDTQQTLPLGAISMKRGELLIIDGR